MLDEKKLSKLTFANDAALVTNNTKEAQIILLAIEKYVAEVGLFLNTSKTVIVITTGVKTSNEEQEITAVKASDGTIIKVVKVFKHLGS